MKKLLILAPGIVYALVMTAVIVDRLGTDSSDPYYSLLFLLLPWGGVVLTIFDFFGFLNLSLNTMTSAIIVSILAIALNALSVAAFWWALCELQRYWGSDTK
jgi:hypothetical protein